jgi:hypothetical protein
MRRRASARWREAAIACATAGCCNEAMRTWDSIARAARVTHRKRAEATCTIARMIGRLSGTLL